MPSGARIITNTKAPTSLGKTFMLVFFCAFSDGPTRAHLRFSLGQDSTGETSGFFANESASRGPLLTRNCNNDPVEQAEDGRGE